MKGEESLARALRACADAWYTVPGYPVTRLAELVQAEMVVNEKVAVEYALGDSLAGRRSAVIMKNVGMNACADPLVNASTQGIRSGVVIVAGDDLEVTGSQNAQDSRYYGEVAQVPVIEPDRETCGQSVEAAFAASEKFSRIALLRVSPPLLETEVQEDYCTRTPGQGTLADASLTMRGRAIRSDQGLQDMFSWSQLSTLNRLRGGSIGVGPAVGTSHVVTVYPPPPLPPGASVNEYGRPFVREHRGLNPPGVRRQPETFSMRGKYRTYCPSCPFKPLLALMKERELQAACDMGCAILALNPPYQVGVCGYGLGSSVAVAARSTGVALTGDYAMLHSGLNALIDVREKQLPLLCLVMKNLRLGMVGTQNAYDPIPYLAWADPVVCPAERVGTIRELLEKPDRLRVIVVEGVCPEGERHEIVEC
ncbi:MAG: thiamine pyrophosphate-dependent enzyme [Methanomicrobiales archaeon]|nr:thiamine pyrophosphate-dependent enzyme [Methanomicrobiales archaeon]